MVVYLIITSSSAPYKITVSDSAKSTDGETLGAVDSEARVASRIT